jgi:hypothetical protein
MTYDIPLKRKNRTMHFLVHVDIIENLEVLMITTEFVDRYHLGKVTTNYVSSTDCYINEIGVLLTDVVFDDMIMPYVDLKKALWNEYKNILYKEFIKAFGV